MAYRLYTLPYSPKPFYSQSVSIDGTSYKMFFKWNRRTQCHYLTITSPYGVVLENQALLVGEKITIRGLLPNTYWFLYLFSRGENTVLEKPEDFLLGAWVYE